MGAFTDIGDIDILDYLLPLMLFTIGVHLIVAKSNYGYPPYLFWFYWPSQTLCNAFVWLCVMSYCFYFMFLTSSIGVLDILYSV